MSGRPIYGASTGGPPFVRRARLGALAAALAAAASEGCGLLWDLPERELDERVACAGGSCACIAGYGDCDGDSGNGCETDVRVSAAHCGRCGHDCRGGECDDGACLSVALSPAAIVRHLAADDTHVYWSEWDELSTGASEFRLKRVKKTGGQAELVAGPDQPAVNGPVIVSGQCLWSDEYGASGATIWARAVDASAPARVVATYAGGIVNLAANADYVYVVSYTLDAVPEPNFIGRAPLGGGAVEILTPVNGYRGDDLGLDDGHVYWYERPFDVGYGPIIGLPLDGGVPVAQSTVPTYAFAVAADGIYFVGGDADSPETIDTIWHLPGYGAEAVPLFRRRPNPYDVFAGGGTVAWIEGAAGTPVLMTKPPPGGSLPVELLESKFSTNVVLDESAMYWALDDRIMMQVR